MSCDIVTMGEILVEILCEDIGQSLSLPGKLSGPFPSGAPAIMIDQAALMGSRCSIISRVGSDDFAHLCLNRLNSHGVSTKHVSVSEDNSTGTAFVTYQPDGERHYLFHFRYAACGELSPVHVDYQVIKNARILHIMGCSLTGSPSMREAIIEAVRLAEKEKVKISFDPNIRKELLKGSVMDVFREILDACDLLLSGRNELALLFPDERERTAFLKSKKGRIVALKAGSHGSDIISEAGAFFVPAFKTIEKDPTGAGDCFDGTFLSLLCQGYDLEKATVYANAAGSLAVSKRGPMEGNCNLFEVEKLIKEQGYPQITAIENF